jgi:hypothetical protein
MTDTRERALEKAVKLMAEYAKAGVPFNVSETECNVNEISVWRLPEQDGEKCSRFKYATPKPIPEKGTVVEVWDGGHHDRRKMGWSVGVMEGDCLVAYMKHDGSNVVCFDNWRVVGNGEEMLVSDVFSDQCAGCKLDSNEYGFEHPKCQQCTTTRPSNWVQK